MRGVRRTAEAIATIAIVVGAVACAAPPDPVYPDQATIGPPVAVGDTCELPWPQNFAQTWFVMADLDQGFSCEVFLEQDECAVGIYYDCTDDSSDPREWQGTVDSDPAQKNDFVPVIYLEAKYDAERRGSRLPRSPACCDGGLYPRGEMVTATWGLLSCHDSSCGSNFDRTHTGLFVERRADVDLSAQMAGQVAFAATGTITAAAYTERRLWAIVQPDIFIHDPVAKNTERLAIAVNGAKHLATSADGVQVYVAGSELVRIDATTRTETRRGALPAPATAIAVTSAGVLVAYDAAGGGAEVELFDATSLTSTNQRTHFEASVTGLATLDRGERLAIATAQGQPFVYLLTTAGGFQALPLIEFDEITAMDLGPIVPRVPFSVEGDRAGVIAPCYEDVAPKRHCYFEVDTAPVSEERLVRIGIPDIEDLEVAHFDATSNRIVFGTSDGKVAFVDRTPSYRLRVQHTLTLGVGPIRALAVDESTQKAFVAPATGGTASVVLEPLPEDME